MIRWTITLLLTAVFASTGFSQIYITTKGDTVSYKTIPPYDDPAIQIILGDRVFKSYYDTIHHFNIIIPDSFEVRNTNNKNLVLFRLPKLNNKYDFVSLTCFSKKDFKSIDSLVYNNLTKHKPGQNLNGNKQAVFQSATLVDSITYKVQLKCDNNFCTQLWIFKENEFGYYIIMLACRKENYQLRLHSFNKFVTDNFKLN